MTIFEFGSQKGSPLLSVESASGVPLNVDLSVSYGGVTFSGVASKVMCSEGDTRDCVIRFYSRDEESILECRLRVRMDREYLLGELVVQNPEPMAHPGGNWDLGADGNLLLEELSLRVSHQGEPTRFLLTRADSEEVVSANRRLEVFQCSSGGENWDSRNHINRDGDVTLEFKGFRICADGHHADGLRIQPCVSADFGEDHLSMTCARFWEEFPKSLRADSDGLTLGLFPRESRGGHELQGGEQKTFEFAIGFGTSDRRHIFEVLKPNLEDKTIEWPYLQKRGSESDSRYELLVDLAIRGEDSFFFKREAIDEYGWRSFGDIWGDHEAVFHDGDSPMISHYNNQYDCTLGFGIHYLRTGDQRWLDLMLPMADHAWDIDTYHTKKDKLLYNGGLFWHTYHYADAGTATHRSYPRELRINQSFEGGNELSELGDTGDKLAKTYQIGGGPAAAHNYSTGWMLAYRLTGKERYRDAAVNAAEYVLGIEDGTKTPFRFFTHSDTGFSTSSSPGYYGPGRASANSTHALLTGHELTGDRRYLDRAAKLMRRTVSPKQDLESLDLLNAELRWFYTMYLQALARYLDYKLKLDEIDADFRYGVSSLRHYARWMLKNERPTLSEPGKLQYPTETWAAQDIRKWHVLEHAARYECDAGTREEMCEKADFFFNYVVDYLCESPTKALCRPVVLMLNFGWQREWLVAHRSQPAFSEPIDQVYPAFLPFAPQRTIAVKRAKIMLAGLAMFFIATCLMAILWACS